jgi:hypothetical protein
MGRMCAGQVDAGHGEKYAPEGQRRMTPACPARREAARPCRQVEGKVAPRISIDHEKLAQLCRRRGIRKLALFGSVLRDDFGPASDIDVLVEFEPGRVPGFFGLHQIECEIAALFEDRKVDLLTFRSLNRHLKDRILSEAEVQYAA